MTNSSAPSSSPITSVPHNSQPSQDATHLLPPILLLELRGTHIELDRETLVSLPESILLVMFPNGVILSKNPKVPSGTLSSDSKNWINHIIYVDFDAAMLQFILNFYSKIEMNKLTQQDSLDLSLLFNVPPGPSSPFNGKRPFVILREELDYFTIAEPSDVSLSQKVTSSVKAASGRHLMNSRKIFDAFERNIHGGSNLAERQLVDMLCLSGFNRSDEWGYRCIEPLRASLVSICLVSLNASEESIKSGVTNKLLLFWRKPARKCWWDIEHTTLESHPEIPIKIWSRRIWTLELAII